MRVAFTHLILIFFCWPQLSSANNEPLIFGWFEVPPYYSNLNGEPIGFSVDLISRISELADFDFEYLLFDDIPTLFKAQINGDVHIQPGVASLPGLAETNLFSRPVAETNIRLFVRADRANNKDYSEPRNKRIGVAKPSAGSGDSELLQRNQLIDAPNDTVLLHQLLSGQIDGVVVPQERLMAAAYSIRLEQRIAPVGKAIRKFDRVVALHNSRSELMPRINAAIAEMEASGELADLQQKWFLTASPVQPEVLTVGIAHSPPNIIVSENGAVSGYSVEVFQALAERAGLAYEYQKLPSEAFLVTPENLTVDILPFVYTSSESQGRIDATLPIASIPVNAFVRADNTVTSLQELYGKKTAMNTSMKPLALQAGLNAKNIVLHDYNMDLATSLTTGEVDAIFGSKANISALFSLIEQEDDIRSLEEDALQVAVGIGLRRGLGAVRETLNAVIPGYLISDDYQALQKKWFAQPVYWTDLRIKQFIASIALLVFGLVAYSLWQRLQQRKIVFKNQQRELALEREHTEELDKLVKELKRSNRELDEFAYIASHDLKEPMRGIAINANFLTREGLPEKNQKRVDRMVELTTRMEKLISDLLFYSRLGRGGDALKTVDPRTVIEGIDKELTEWLVEKNSKIVVVSDLPLIKGQKPKIKTIFQNLIVNGLKFNDSEMGIVEIGFSEETTVYGDRQFNKFYVRDNGIGIAEKHRDKVFQIFQQLNSKMQYGPGTGAGLSFVRKIIEDSGGNITFISQPGRGTTFYFSLPLAETEHQERLQP